MAQKGIKDMPLVDAAERGDMDGVLAALDASSSVPIAGDEISNALRLAADGGFTDVVGLLLEAGADQSYMGFDAVICATMRDHGGCAELLLADLVKKRMAADGLAALAEFLMGNTWLTGDGRYKDVMTRLAALDVAEREKEVLKRVSSGGGAKTKRSRV